MFKRQRTGAVVCASCRQLVGVNDEVCYSCGRRNPGLWGFSPALRELGADLGFVPFVIGACIVLYVFMLLASGGDIGMNSLFSMLAPSQLAVFLFGASGGVPVFRAGRWWTIFSAGWLHGSLLHIVFNMLAVRQLAPAVAELYGASRMVIVYVVAGAVGFALSSFAFQFLPPLPFFSGGVVTLGASASVFGLLGALVYYGRRGGSSLITGQAISYTISVAIFGFIMPGIDNYAHLGGFGGGYLAARLLDPLRPERIDHLLIALGCLALSLLAVAFSFFHGVQLIRR